jgi:CBS domain-containing protein
VAESASLKSVRRKEQVMATKIAEVMTDRPRAITPQTSIREAARLMDEEGVGSLPIVSEGARLVGIVTDRDIAIRAVGHGRDPEQTPVAEIASEEVYALTPDDDLDDALQTMARAQVRRVPIVVRENELVGMVSQADVARAAKEKTAGEVVEAISQPPRGPRVAGPDVAGTGTRRESARQEPARDSAEADYEEDRRDYPRDA